VPCEDSQGRSRVGRGAARFERVEEQRADPPDGFDDPLVAEDGRAGGESGRSGTHLLRVGTRRSW
jgi:hypothetical protein